VRPPAAAAANWPAFTELLARLEAGSAGWPAEYDLICQWYEPYLSRIHEDAQARIADLTQLGQIAGGYVSRQRFLTDLSLDPPDATSDQAGSPLLDEDYLILSTIHSAKGQEWQVVYLLNVVDGCIPSDMATGSVEELEEERRLLYVAMTRARDELHLLIPQRFHAHQKARFGARHVYASRSRFIPRPILHYFDVQVAGSGVQKGDGVAAAVSRHQVDLRARLREIWR
jgi:DNA helicase-2/ATP-dependent DNA helicase PcrA